MMMLAALSCAGCSTTPVATAKPFATTLRDVCISKDDGLTEGTAQAIERVNRQFGTMFSRKSQCPKARSRTGDTPPASRPPVQPADPKTS